LRLLYDLPNLLKKRMDALLGELDQQLTATVTANVLTEEIEVLLDIRDDRLHRREFQPTFAKKLSTSGFTSPSNISFDLQ
jgi:hypothetical protein